MNILEIVKFLKQLSKRLLNNHSIFIHWCYDPWNCFLKYFQNALIEFVQTSPKLRQLKEVEALLSDFWYKQTKQKTPGTEK